MGRDTCCAAGLTYLSRALHPFAVEFALSHDSRLFQAATSGASGVLVLSGLSHVKLFVLVVSVLSTLRAQVSSVAIEIKQAIASAERFSRRPGGLPLFAVRRERVAIWR